MKRLKILACKVLYREICLLSATSETIIDATYLKQGLHDTPDLLRHALQHEIDLIDEGTDIHSFEPHLTQDFDAILLGYGLCSNAICGLSSKRYKLVIPRAHDCITLFLGSKDKYKAYFEAHKGGVFWYTIGWNENNIPMPGKERVETLHAQYTEKYGEDNADYLMEMEQGWLKEYNMCAYINWPTLHSDINIQHTKQSAEFLNWNFEVLQGDPTLMENFINGNWNDDDFLIVEPGRVVSQSFDEGILKS